MAKKTLAQIARGDSYYQQLSLTGNGWWVDTRDTVWVLGTRTRPAGYTLESLTRQYQAARSSLPHGFRLAPGKIACYVCIRPEQAGALVQEEGIGPFLVPLTPIILPLLNLVTSIYEDSAFRLAGNRVVIAIDPRYKQDHMRFVHRSKRSSLVLTLDRPLQPERF